MSETANWSYENKATIKPVIGIDHFTGGMKYGEEYEIDCTWTAENELMRDDKGQEFISSTFIFTEDKRPKVLDMIKIHDGFSGFQEIKAKTGWDMSFFDEEPDFKLAV